MAYMDLLFKRYASPYTLINEMLKCGRFSEFVTEFLRMNNKDTEEQTLWEWYLHHTFLDKTFEQFKEMLGISTVTEVPEKEDFKTTVQNSMSILKGFVPDD